MTDRLQTFAVLVLASTILGGCSEDPASDSRAIALEMVTGDGVRAHMEALSTDAMAGREAGTAGYNDSAAYVAQAYRQFGLTPLGDDGTYLQTIEFFESRLVPDSARATLHVADSDIDLKFRDDFVMGAGYADPEQSIRAGLSFAGYGITAPEYDHDDYADIDVSGRIVVLLSGAPAHFATEQRAYYSSGRTKADIAIARGAVGIVTIRTPVDIARRPWERFLPGIGRPGMRWIQADGTPYRAYPELEGGALLSETGAGKLFDAARKDLVATFDKHGGGATGAFHFDVEMTLARKSIQRMVTSANVVGAVPGRDPEIRGEYVVYSAHLDHIGVRPGKDGDDIHNGAYDNAAGIGVILEIAEAMMAMPEAPRRSVIFAAVTAEEKGLQGSSYFARNPPVPVDQLVANVNIDMPYLGFPVADVEAFGAEHSTLASAVRRAMADVGMELTPDPMPEEVRFVRSDQFSFVQEGIPAIAFKAGSKSSDSDVDGKAMLTDFLKNHYHQASDEVDLPFSPEGAERYARGGLLTGLYIANDDERPRWNDGDFFGELYAR